MLVLDILYLQIFIIYAIISSSLFYLIYLERRSYVPIQVKNHSFNPQCYI